MRNGIKKADEKKYEEEDEELWKETVLDART